MLMVKFFKPSNICHLLSYLISRETFIYLFYTRRRNLHHFFYNEVVIGHATHLYLDHTYEPDPLEPGASWASRYINTKKIFGFVPSDVYFNADRNSNNKPLTSYQICPNSGRCTVLKRPENIIGTYMCTRN